MNERDVPAQNLRRLNKESAPAHKKGEATPKKSASGEGNIRKRKEKLKCALEETNGMDVARADNFTVATWLRTWYDLYAKPNVRVATADQYELVINTYTIPRIGNIKLTKFTSRDLQKLYKDLMEKGRERKTKANSRD